MKSLTLKSGLFSALSTLVNREFTVHDLTEAYLNDSACLHSSQKAARQFVYRNMLRLINNGELTRVVVESGWPLYRLTPRFKAPGGTPLIAVAPLATQDKATVTKDSPRQSLQERLNRHKLEMLSAMGETEEYDAICSEMPELRDDVQPLYNQSRDKCSRLLGRVKALESLLAKETDLVP